MSGYEYVRKAYGVDPVVGKRVRHTELSGPRAFGVIASEDRGMSQYVMVRFDGKKHADPCHPRALDYEPVAAPKTPGGE